MRKFQVVIQQPRQLPRPVVNDLNLQFNFTQACSIFMLPINALFLSY